MSRGIEDTQKEIDELEIKIIKQVKKIESIIFDTELLKKDKETWLWEIEYETKIKAAYIKKQQFFQERNLEQKAKLQRSKKCQNCAVQIEKLSILKDQHQQRQKEIAYKSGFLHCREVIEKCEYNFRWKSNIRGRKDLWLYIFNNHYLVDKEDKDIFPRLSSQDLANQIVILYDMLSKRVHASFLNDVKIVHINSVSELEARIIAFLCHYLGIQWESDIIGKDFRKLSKEEIEKACFRIGNKISYF